MAQKIKIDQLSRTMEDALQDYKADTADKMKAAVEQTTEEMAQEIWNRASVNTRWKKYIRAFDVKTVYEDTMNLRKRWYVKAPHYRLTHLLEKGHRVVDRNGKVHGRTRAFPHIQYGAELAQRRLPELLREEIEK